MHHTFRTFNFIKPLLVILLITAGCFQAENANTLIQKLKDEDYNVRKNAAEALGKTKDSHAVEPLIAALNDEKYDVQQKAAEALVKIGTTSVEPLIAALKDKDWNVRWKTAWLLGEIKDIRAVKPLIIAIKDESPDVRENAAEALGKMQDARAIEPLITTLKDKVDNVKWKTIIALGKIKDSHAVELLIAIMNDSWDSQSKTVALKKPLIDALRHKYYVTVDARTEAAKALGEIKDPRAIQPLIDALKDWDVRNSAARALVEIKDPDLLIHILQMPASSESPSDPPPPAPPPGGVYVQSAPNISTISVDVRQIVAGALGEIKDRRAIDFLIVALKNKDLAVVSGAYAFFIHRGEKGTEPVLIEALNKYGFDEMVVAFLNCGNNKLKEAAEKWASNHHRAILEFPSDRKSPLRWGNK